MSVVVSNGVVLSGLPESRVEPLAPEGYFTGQTSGTGDASGGTFDLRASITARQNRAYVFVLDAISSQCSTGDGGEALMQILGWMGDERSGQYLPYRLVGSHVSAHGRRYTTQEFSPPRVLVGTQLTETTTPISIVIFNYQTNVNTLAYELNVFGRYYRRNQTRDPAFLEKVFR